MGVILVLSAAISFTFSTYFGKIVTNTTDMSGVITSFYRFFLGAVIMFAYILIKKKSFKATDIKPIIYRSGFNSLAIMLYSIAYAYTTMTNINMLHMTNPIFVVLLAPYFTKEKVDKKKYLYLIITMVGMYVVTNPSLGDINTGDVLALLSAVMASFSIMSLSNATKHNETYVILFYVMVIGTLLNLPLAYKDILSFEMIGLFPVFMSSLLGFLGQIFITFGFKYVDSSTGSLINTSRIVVAAIVGYVFLDEIITVRTLIGMISIIGSLVGLSGYFDKKGKGKKTISE